MIKHKVERRTGGKMSGLNLKERKEVVFDNINYFVTPLSILPKYSE